MHDVVVIGGGAAGAFCSMALAARGAGVAVVHAGPPSAIASRGAAFVGRKFPADGEFARLWSKVLPGLSQGPGIFPAVDGECVQAACAGAWAVEAGEIAGKDVVVADMPGLPCATAGLLAWRIGQGTGCNARGATLRLPSSVEEFDLTPALWGRWFDDRDIRKRLVDQLVARALDFGAQTVLVPPILGVDAHDQVMTAIDADGRVKVRELLGGPGWPPGLRVGIAIRQALAASGVSVVRGSVSSFEKDGPARLGAISTAEGDRIEGRSFVLATGGIAGGGLRLEGALRETALGLPVFIGQEQVKAPAGEGGLDPSLLFGEEPCADHPILQAGVRLDAEKRPIDLDGTPAFSNLHACGSIAARVPGEPRPAVLDPGPDAYSGWILAQSLGR